MVDVVRTEPCAHQLLEEVRLLVGALGRAEAGERVAIPVSDLNQTLRGGLESLFPGRFAKYRRPIAGIDHEVRRLGDAVSSDQRLCQPVRMVRVVESIAPLHAQA